MFCSNCGQEVSDTASFCTKCGTPIKSGFAPDTITEPIPVAAPAPAPAAEPQAPYMNPQQAPYMNPQQAPFANQPVPGVNYPIQIVPTGKSIRYRCPVCKDVADVPGDTACTKCGAPASAGGYIKMYRMGSPYGVAMPFGIYIDNEPTGYIGNTQTCWIRVPFGTHRVHIAAATNRRCDDMMVTITPDHPLEAVKVRMKAGFWSNKFQVIATTPSEIPD